MDWKLGSQNTGGQAMVVGTHRPYLDTEMAQVAEKLEGETGMVPSDLMGQAVGAEPQWTYILECPLRHLTDLEAVKAQNVTRTHCSPSTSNIEKITTGSF